MKNQMLARAATEIPYELRLGIKTLRHAKKSQSRKSSVDTHLRI